VNKYLELLPIVADRGWRVIDDGDIRDKDFRCPLCALVHELSGGTVDHYQMVCMALAAVGAPVDSDSDDIIDAADYDGSPLRDDLMVALGMKP
jgi:hypothetical protein